MYAVMPCEICEDTTFFNYTCLFFLSKSRKLLVVIVLVQQFNKFTYLLHHLSIILMIFIFSDKNYIYLSRIFFLFIYTYIYPLKRPQYLLSSKSDILKQGSKIIKFSCNIASVRIRNHLVKIYRDKIPILKTERERENKLSTKLYSIINVVRRKISWILLQELNG